MTTLIKSINTLLCGTTLFRHGTRNSCSNLLDLLIYKHGIRNISTPNSSNLKIRIMVDLIVVVATFFEVLFVIVIDLTIKVEPPLVAIESFLRRAIFTSIVMRYVHIVPKNWSTSTDLFGQHGTVNYVSEYNEQKICRWLHFYQKCSARLEGPKYEKMDHFDKIDDLPFTIELGTLRKYN